MSQYWYATYRKSLSNPRLIAARKHGGKTLSGQQVPQHILEFLHTEKDGKCQLTWRELADVTTQEHLPRQHGDILSRTEKGLEMRFHFVVDTPPRKRKERSTPICTVDWDNCYAVSTG